MRAQSCTCMSFVSISDPLELRVADNGIGLTDITKALVLFSSTKSEHALPGTVTGQVKKEESIIVQK